LERSRLNELRHQISAEKGEIVAEARRRRGVRASALKLLEKRVAVLEQQVGAILSLRTGVGPAKDWRSIRGAFTGDEVMKQIFEEGRKIREADRKRAQRRKRD
jgi:hypothetical protein